MFSRSGHPIQASKLVPKWPPKWLPSGPPSGPPESFPSDQTDKRVILVYKIYHTTVSYL